MFSMLFSFGLCPEAVGLNLEQRKAAAVTGINLLRDRVVDGMFSS
jgi:hypothetical protein